MARDAFDFDDYAEEQWISGFECCLRCIADFAAKAADVSDEARQWRTVEQHIMNMRFRFGDAPQRGHDHDT